MAAFYFNIDVLGLGACNLSCPSCPVGNSKDVNNPKGLMEPDLLDRILTKAKSECEIERVGLFNWTEPLLHPRLDELVAVVHTHGLLCDLSSNLNKLKNIEKVLLQNPFLFRISNSGFNQDIYSQSHRGGDIETVKRNMRSLMEIKRRVESTTDIHLLFHRYRDNLDDEPLMRAFCNELGIEFIPVLAFFTPVEKVVAYLENDPSLANITQEDRDVMKKLLLPLDEAIDAVRNLPKPPCTLQEDQITLDFRGAVQLCCATYDSTKYTLCDYLETPLQEIQNMKYQSSMCTRCLSHGVHVYYTAAGADFKDIALAHTPGKHREMLIKHPS